LWWNLAGLAVLLLLGWILARLLVLPLSVLLARLRIGRLLIVGWLLLSILLLRLTVLLLRRHLLLIVNLRRLLLNNNLGLLTHNCNTSTMQVSEGGPHVDSSSWEATILQFDPLLNWSSRNKEGKRNLGVSDRFTV
jgi:hypothetical protein